MADKFRRSDNYVHVQYYKKNEEDGRSYFVDKDKKEEADRVKYQVKSGCWHEEMEYKLPEQAYEAEKFERCLRLMFEYGYRNARADVKNFLDFKDHSPIP